MPAVLDEPANPPIFRAQYGQNAPLPLDVYPRQVTLRDRITVATVLPFPSPHQIPYSLRAYLSDQMNKEIEMGDTYPFLDPMSVEQFSAYWFQEFGAVMLLGNIESVEEVMEERDWARLCLGSFYIRPNYTGRSSHICSAGFLVTDAARNKGVGRLMGETYLEWAPRLGYSYSVFNLVFETNVASCRIWDALGFKRIGRVKGAGNLKSYPGQLIDAIIYGRDLGPEEQDLVSEERFDKIKYYLKYGTYPTGADRAEKSRLRSAATHYKLLENDKLMLKDKEVISDPQRQYEIAKSVHIAQHAGINKTTAVIALKYHWVRIKETVSQVIKNCAECKELGKVPIVRPDGISPRRPATNSNNIIPQPNMGGSVSAAGRILSLPNTTLHQYQPHVIDPPGSTSVSPQVLSRTLPSLSHHHPPDPHLTHSYHSRASHPTPISSLSHAPNPSHSHSHHHTHHTNDYMPLDPQMMISEEASLRQQLDAYNQEAGISSRHHNGHRRSPEPQHHDHDENDENSFQAMLGDGARRDSTAGLDMLIDEDESEEDEDDDGDRGMETADGERQGGGVVPGGNARDVNMDGMDEAGRKRRAEEAARGAVEALRMRGNG